MEWELFPGIREVKSPGCFTRSLSYLFFCFLASEPVPTFWYYDLEPCPVPGCAGFGNRNPGYREDIPREKEPQAGVPAEILFKNKRFVLIRYTPAIILHKNPEALIRLTT